jgi:hypothetical protein
MTKDLIKNLAVAGGLIAVALSATWARNRGLIEAETVTRLVMGTIGLMLVWYGNRMPKAFVPAARTRQIQRLGAWSMVLSGLAYGLLWALAPIDVATVGGCAVVIAGLLVTFGFCIVLRRRSAA